MDLGQWICCPKCSSYSVRISNKSSIDRPDQSCGPRLHNKVPEDTHYSRRRKYAALGTG